MEWLLWSAIRGERWRVAGDGDGGLDGARAALDDDLDTPTAVLAIADGATTAFAPQCGLAPSGTSDSSISFTIAWASARIPKSVRQ